MTKKLRSELQHRIELFENILDEMDQRLTGTIARMEWMQIEAARARGESPTMPTTEQAWATPAPGLLRRLLNGSWPLRDGNTYPPFHPKGPIGGYDGYVRRSPPATD